MNDVIVIGGGGHAKVVLDAIAATGLLRAVGVIVAKGSTPDPGITPPVVGTDDLLADALKSCAGVVVAIGDNFTRWEMVRRIHIARPGVEFVSVTHPSAVISPSARIGEGTVIMPGAVVNAGCAVGAHCIINTRASLDHDGIMGDYSALAPGATVGGRCAIGTGAWVGLGASVIHGRAIGEHAVIGAGAVVVDDIPDHAVAVGCPARVLRKRKADEKYL